VRVIQNITVMLPSLIRKLGQIGLNFSKGCAFQKENGMDMLQNRLNPNEYTTEKYYSLYKII